MHTRRNVEEVFNVFQEHKTLVIQDYVEACVWYQKAADKKALAKLSQMKAITRRLGDEVRRPAVQKFARGWKKDPSHLHLNQPLTFTLSVDFHPAPFEPTLQCARCQIMLLTKFAPPQPLSLFRRAHIYLCHPAFKMARATSAALALCSARQAGVDAVRPHAHGGPPG